jgi:hypothetical protein
LCAGSIVLLIGLTDRRIILRSQSGLTTRGIAFGGLGRCPRIILRLQARLGPRIGLGLRLHPGVVTSLERLLSRKIGIYQSLGS